MADNPFQSPEAQEDDSGIPKKAGRGELNTAQAVLVIFAFVTLLFLALVYLSGR